MSAVIAGIVSAVVTIANVVYSIGRVAYNYLIVPIQKITAAIDKVKGFIEKYIQKIRDFVESIMVWSKVDYFIDLVNGVKFLADKVKALLDRNRSALINVLANLYETIAGVAKDCIHIITESLSPVFDRLNRLKADIYEIQKFNIGEIVRDYENITIEIKRMTSELIPRLEEEWKEEVKQVRDSIDLKVITLSRDIDRVASLSEDLKHFVEMLAKAMEL